MKGEYREMEEEWWGGWEGGRVKEWRGKSGWMVEMCSWVYVASPAFVPFDP